MVGRDEGERSERNNELVELTQIVKGVTGKGRSIDFERMVSVRTVCKPNK